MKYTLNKTNYRNFKVFEDSKRAARAYSIPYTSKEQLASIPFEKERVSSELVRLLSGEWEFKYYASLSELPGKIDTASVDFDKISVPSTWQRTGYEPPVYLNCPYPFDEVNPALPEDMSAGVYRKLFSIDSLDKKYIIAFLGVVPCIDLYVNGKYVGYSEGAHNTAEFELNKYLKVGENELVAVLHKWSTGTYLECQDMFRENGIFRDVLLYELPQTFINDYAVRTVKTDAGYDLFCDVAVLGDTTGCKIAISLTSGGKEIACAENDAADNVTLSLSSLDVTEWNAEIPTLYELYISLTKDGNESECIRNYTGFRTIKIDGCVYTFNGKKIKIKGVNHHDSQYKTGYVMTIDDLLKDVRLMKSLNVNAIRTSHYPPDPQLLTLCDIYGLYVVDEADIETHGCCYPPHNNIDIISNDLKWAPRYLDRVSRMYYRDRSHPSIFMWSLGNESGGWKCHDKCFKFLQEICPEIPVHYEGAIRTPRHGYSVISEMYTHPKDLILVRERKRGAEYKNKPFFLCEYCHAMGVGPGALEDYWDILYSDDIFMGGCIWEWTDHAIYHEKGKLKYTYGGDHGEKKHDGNFCVDGLVYPDRTPHTGAYEMKAVYRPLRASLVSDSTFSFKNTNRFRSSGYISIGWELLQNGTFKCSGSFTLDIAPEDTKEITLDLPTLESGEYHINFTYTDSGAEIAKEQIALKEVLPVFEPVLNRRISVSDTAECITVAFDGGSAVFGKASGTIVSYTANGKEMLNLSPVSAIGIVPNLSRALLDNDVRPEDSWKKAGLASLRRELISYQSSADELSAKLTSKFALSYRRKHLFDCTISYTVFGNGKVLTEAALAPVGKCEVAGNLPRFGICTELARTLENVEYYGLGERENLSDYTAQSTVGIYSTTVAAMHEPYIKPQDNGNRTEIRYLKLTDDDGDGLVFEAANKFFSFSAHNYTQKLLEKAKHQEDLHDENTTFLSIDGFMRGTGTSSCGPDTLPKYIIDGTNGLEFSFTFAPVKKKCDEPLVTVKKTAKVSLDSKFIPRATSPEAVGISSKSVEEFANALNSSGVRYHSFMIIRDGKVAAECFRRPYNPTSPHILYSISKSITSCAVGFAIDEGYFTLDTKVADIFPERIPSKDTAKFREITVRHLLTMTAGKFPSYLLNKSKGNWISHFTDAKWYANPGEEFKYINENIFMLCAIIKRTTGISVSEFLTPRLWEPLGIKTPYWETDENGVESGGWGIFLTHEAFSKFLLTYLQDGVFEGKQIVPAQWVKESTTLQTRRKGHPITDESGYGYCFWIRNQGDFHAAGIFGQIGHIDRNNNLIISVISGDTNDYLLWQAIDSFYKSDWDIEPQQNAAPNPALARKLSSFAIDTPPYSSYRSLIETDIDSRTILFRPSLTANAAGFPPSVLPVVATYMTKDRAGNIDKVRFRFHDHYCYFQWSEGDETCCVKVGLDGRYRASRVTLAGTRYTMYSAASWINSNTLEVTIRPIESIGKRVLSFHFSGKSVTLETYTDPSIDEVIATVKGIISDMFKSEKGKALGEKIFISLRDKIQPTLKGEIR